MEFIEEYRELELWGWCENTDFDGVGYSIGVYHNDADIGCIFTETLRITGSAISILYGKRNNTDVSNHCRSILRSKAKARIDAHYYEKGATYTEDINSDNVKAQYEETDEREIRYYLLRTLYNIRRNNPTKYKSDIFQFKGFCPVFRCKPETLLYIISILEEDGAVGKQNSVPVNEGGIYITSVGIDLLSRLDKDRKSTVASIDEGGMILPDNKKVFVIHGRNENLRKSMFDFLRCIGLQPIEWVEAISLTGKSSPYIGEILSAAFGHAQAIVSLLTPDDEARLSERFWGKHEPDYETKLTPQARPNVLFETGMAFGRDQDRTIIVEVGNLRPFSDIAGRHVVKINNTPEKRQELVTRLKLAGCEINTSGTDWFSTGDFNL